MQDQVSRWLARPILGAFMSGVLISVMFRSAAAKVSISVVDERFESVPHVSCLDLFERNRGLARVVFQYIARLTARLSFRSHLSNRATAARRCSSTRRETVRSAARHARAVSACTRTSRL